LRRRAPAALPTLTLAEIYAAQGHRTGPSRRWKASSPGSPTTPQPAPCWPSCATRPIPSGAPPPAGGRGARRVARARRHGYPANGAPAPEPSHMLDDAPPPEYYDVDECVAIPVDPHTLYVYWEARDATLAPLRVTYPDGSLALRLVVVVPTWEGRRRRCATTLSRSSSETISPATCRREPSCGWPWAGCAETRSFPSLTRRRWRRLPMPLPSARRRAAALDPPRGGPCPGRGSRRDRHRPGHRMGASRGDDDEAGDPAWRGAPGIQ